MVIEVVVYNIESALRAQQAGADRIELCDNPAEGGTTPSFGVLESVRQNINIDLYVMIRPRGGDFVYSNYDFHAMKRDAWKAMKQSADGVVLGIVTPEGRLDVKRCKELIDRARPMKVTCHRAFDVTRDPMEALEDAIAAGFDRILTSGHRAKASDNIPLIKSLVEAAGNRISIMPGAGITLQNAWELVSQTGVKEIHLSASGVRPSAMAFQHPHLSAVPGLADASIRTVDVDVIKQLRHVLG